MPCLLCVASFGVLLCSVCFSFHYCLFIFFFFLGVLLRCALRVVFRGGCEPSGVPLCELFVGSLDVVSRLAARSRRARWFLCAFGWGVRRG